MINLGSFIWKHWGRGGGNQKRLRRTTHTFGGIPEKELNNEQKFKNTLSQGEKLKMDQGQNGNFDGGKEAPRGQTKRIALNAWGGGRQAKGGDYP